MNLSATAKRIERDRTGSRLRSVEGLLREWAVTARGDGEILDHTGETTLWWDREAPLSVNRVARGDEQFYRLRYADEISVDVLGDNRLSAATSAGLRLSTLDHFIVDQVIPRVLAEAGSFVLHSGAVRCGKRIALIVGTSGRGKSTLCASFADAELLGDDAMIVSFGDEVMVRAVYRSLRLLPDSVAALIPSVVDTSLVADHSRKHQVELAALADPAEAPQPLTAIFVLGAPGTNDAIECRPARPADACMAIVENSFALNPADINQARRRLDRARQLVARVPCWQLSYPRDYDRLPEVRAAMLDSMEAATA